MSKCTSFFKLKMGLWSFQFVSFETASIRNEGQNKTNKKNQMKTKQKHKPKHTKLTFSTTSKYFFNYLWSNISFKCEGWVYPLSVWVYTWNCVHSNVCSNIPRVWSALTQGLLPNRYPFSVTTTSQTTHSSLTTCLTFVTITPRDTCKQPVKAWTLDSITWVHILA